MTDDKWRQTIEAIVRDLFDHASNQAAGYDVLASQALDDAAEGIAELDADAENQR